MAVNRDHVPGLLIKASLDLHFVDISLPFRLHNNEAGEEAELWRIINFTQCTTVEPSSAIPATPHRQKPCAAKKNRKIYIYWVENWQKANLITTKWPLWPHLGPGVTHTGANTHAFCQRQEFCNLSLHKYIHSRPYVCLHCRRRCRFVLLRNELFSRKGPST